MRRKDIRKRHERTNNAHSVSTRQRPRPDEARLPRTPSSTPIDSLSSSGRRLSYRNHRLFAADKGLGNEKEPERHRVSGSDSHTTHTRRYCDKYLKPSTFLADEKRPKAACRHSGLLKRQKQRGQQTRHKFSSTPKYRSKSQAKAPPLTIASNDMVIATREHRASTVGVKLPSHEHSLVVPRDVQSLFQKVEPF